MTDYLEDLRAEAREGARKLALARPTTAPEPSICVPRVFSPGRGGGQCVWILGRIVRTMSTAPTKVPDLTFEEFLAAGYPEDVAVALGTERVAQVTAAVSQLAPRSCMCDTGAQTPGQHGTIRTLASAQNPNATVDDRTTIGFCTVCRRAWVFNEAGDAHYEYFYSVEPFEL